MSSFVRRALMSLPCLAFATAAQAEIRIDYDDYHEKVEQIAPYKHIAVAAAVRHEDSGEHCVLESVYIKSRQGTELLPQASPIRLELPVKADWYDKDTQVVIKAPGDCEFSMEWVQAPLKTAELDYSELFAGLADFRKMAEADAGLFSSTTIAGLRFGFAGDAKAVLTVHAKAGDRLFAAQEGWLDLAEDAALAAENPKVSFNVLPERILPLSD